MPFKARIYIYIYIYKKNKITKDMCVIELYKIISLELKVKTY